MEKSIRKYLDENFKSEEDKCNFLIEKLEDVFKSPDVEYDIEKLRKQIYIY